MATVEHQHGMPNHFCVVQPCRFFWGNVTFDKKTTTLFSWFVG